MIFLKKSNMESPRDSPHDDAKGHRRGDFACKAGLGTDRRALEKVGDGDVQHADAARRDALADARRHRSAMDAVERVGLALEEIERPRAERIAQARRIAVREFAGEL
jgi:hypothetical protein